MNASFVPNFFKIWGHSPIALKGVFPAMQYILADGELNRTLKEMIMIVISSSKDCNYCETAHHAFCAIMGGNPQKIDSLKSGSSLANTADPKEKFAIDFAVRLSIDLNSSSEKDFELLIGLDYTKSQVMELIAISGMAIFYNHLAYAIKIDKEFRPVTKC